MSHGIAPLSAGTPIVDYYVNPYEFVYVDNTYTGDTVTTPANIFIIFVAADVVNNVSLTSLPPPELGRSIMVLNNSAYTVSISGQNIINSEEYVMFLGNGTAWIKCGV